MKKTIGILGGMGPLATCDLYSRITACTKAAADQEHLHVLIESNPSVPDRTAAILHGGKDPAPTLISMAKNLESMGADVLIMACNTAHYYYDVIAAQVSAEFLHMPRETAKRAGALGYKKIALLGTDATIQTGIYHDAFAREGIAVEVLDAPAQAALMQLIYQGVKAGNRSLDPTVFVEGLKALEARGAQAFILGCTEIPIIFDWYKLPFPALDPTQVLAEAAILAAGGALKEER